MSAHTASPAATTQQPTANARRGWSEVGSIARPKCTHARAVSQPACGTHARFACNRESLRAQFDCGAELGGSGGDSIRMPMRWFGSPPITVLPRCAK